MSAPRRSPPGHHRQERHREFIGKLSGDQKKDAT
jgi:hypothetical protein